MARKSWDQLTPAYRRRLERAGIGPNDINRTAARGHGKTPEHPERAQRYPEKYGGYIERRSDLLAKAWAHKRKLFGDQSKWNERRAKRNLYSPQSIESRIGNGQPPSIAQLRAFLLMRNYDEAVDNIEWGDPVYFWAFYH